MENKQSISMKKLVKIMILMVISLNVGAKNFTVSDKLNVNEVIPGNWAAVSNPIFESDIKDVENWQDKLRYYKVENRIILLVNAKHKQFQPESYQADVQLKITRDVINPDGSISYSKEEPLKTMSVTFNRNGPYKAKSVITLEGGHNMKVEVISVTPLATSKVMNLELIVETYFEQYKELKYDDLFSVNHNSEYVNSRNELEITWPFQDGAESYDLEWTFVNNVAENGTYLPETQIEINDQIFRANSTRVSLKDFSEHNGQNISYRIPLIYEQGYILYRVRAVGVDINNVSNFIEGVWSSTLGYSKVSEFKNANDNNNNYYFLQSGHEERLNWQSSVTFIEEGKNKVAVSYADGTLRSRQQVSRLNSEDETVIGETVYDHQGRKAVDIIPAPTGRKKIEFTPNYNVDIEGKSYSRQNFDLDDDNQCNLSSAPIENTSGAGKYYSSENELKFQHDVAIPDAKGYPFIQTVYTNDNTGRIRAQGGIGVDHKIGSGHETKNYYGKPLQVEIDRMFGSEAGYASHYQKNLVVDPNGQVTVSYLDLKGNVVATSLAGVSPNELQKLTSNVPSYIQEDLLVEERNASGEIISKQSISDDKMSKIYNQEILVSSDDDYRKFTYEVEPEKLEISLNCSDGTKVEKYCFDCVLNIELMVINKCGKEMLINGALEGAVVNEQLLNQVVKDNQLIDLKKCDREIHPSTYEKTTEPLKIGDYTIRKVLTVNQEVLNHYTENFLASECHKTPEDFYQENKADIDYSGCYTDCKKCEEDLGSYDQYDATLYPNGNCPGLCMSYEQYQAQLSACKELCDNELTTCKSKLDLMKNDLSPLGQYGVIDESNEFYKLSVYNLNNLLPANATTETGSRNVKTESNLSDGIANWRNPKHYSTNQKGYYYKNGERGKVEVTFDGTNFNPELDDKTKVKCLEGYYGVITSGKVIKVEAEYLKNFSDFIKNWPADNSWSESLLIYHPEYGGYEYCIKNSESHVFDKIILKSNTPNEFVSSYNEAFGSGKFEERNTTSNVFDLLGSTSQNALDPFFHPSTEYSGVYSQNLEYSVMKYWMDNYKKYEDVNSSDNNISFTMLELAYLTAECPQGLNTDCGERFCHLAEDGSSIIINNELPTGANEEKIWQAFKSFYIAEKQKLYDIKRNKVSIRQDFYCGCIGNDNWNPGLGGFSSRIFEINNTSDFDAYYFPGGHKLTYASQWFNMRQPCSWKKFNLFRDAEPIFPNLLTESPKSFSSGVQCFLNSEETQEANLPENEFPNTNCPARDNQMIDAMQNKAMLTYMETCGECPVAFDFETLLNILAKNKKLTAPSSDNAIFGCYPVHLEGWTDIINDAAGFEGNAQVNYSSKITDRLLEGEFSNTGNNMSIRLLLESSYKKTNHTTGDEIIIVPTFDDILSICCIEFDDIDVPSELIPSSGQLAPNEYPFNILAKIKHPSLDREVKIKIEGVVSDLDLNNCSIESCLLTQEAYDLSNFFSALTKRRLDFEQIDDFSEIDQNQLYSPGFFTSSSSVPFFEGKNTPEFYSITENLKEAGPGLSSEITAWEWKMETPDLVSDVMEAKLTAYTGSHDAVNGIINSEGIAGSMDFTFTSTESINFSEIIGFLSITPLKDQEETAETNEYGFSALVQLYNENDGYYTKTIEVTHNMTTILQLATCKTFTRENSNPQ